MNKKILQQINNLAKFIFDDSNSNKLMKFINNDQLNDARLLVDDRLDEINLDYNINDNDEELLSQYKQCNELYDVIISLIIGDVAYEEGKQTKFCLN